MPRKIPVKCMRCLAVLEWRTVPDEFRGSVLWSLCPACQLRIWAKPPETPTEQDALEAVVKALEMGLRSLGAEDVYVEALSMGELYVEFRLKGRTFSFYFG